MDKNTMLGIYIEYTHEGTHELMSCNSNSSWVKLLGEITELKQIDKPVNQTWSLEVLQKIESGNVIRVICPNAGRNDYICASIYVPWNIVISGKELSSIVSSTRDEIISWRKETSKSRLMELFSKKYDVVDFQRKEHIESPSGIAYRYYGDYYQLHELLENIEQPYYSNYKFVFFVNNKSNILIKTGDDLTKKDLVETVIVTPPGDVDGFAPYMGKTIFNKPLRVAIGESITLSWIRKGYKTISKTTKIIQKDAKLTYPQINEHEVEIPFTAIRVYDEKNRILDADNYRLRINGKSLEQGGEKVYVNFASLKNVRIDVTPNDTDRYEASSDTYDFSNGGYFNVQLERVQLTYEFQFPLRNGRYAPAKFTFRSRLNSCPFKDYSIDGSDNIVTKEWGTNYLKFKPQSRKFWITCLICSIIVLLLGVCGGYALNDFIGGKADNQEISKLTKENADLKSRIKELEKRNYNYAPKGSESNSDEKSVDAAISYIDHNNVWNRTEMEKHEPLKGLWDAMNERRFDDILAYENVLGKSAIFQELVASIKANRHKTFSGNFNTKANDYDITIKPEGNKKGYIKALEDAGTTPTSHQQNSRRGTPKQEKSTEKKDGLFDFLKN